MAFGMTPPAPAMKEVTPTMKLASPMKKKKKKAMPEAQETPQSEAANHPPSFLRKALAAKK